MMTLTTARRSVLLAAAFSMALAGSVRAGDVGAADDAREAVTKTLVESADAWSRGDLDAFMRSYEDGPDTRYVKRDGVVRGYRAIRDMYQARFGSDPGGLGRLSLEVIDFAPLGEGYALVTGRYHLLLRAQAQAQGGAATGIFTLVFHRSRAGWRIISDHSS
jgi:uncharacterized protein (TIGR02246 family)